MSKRNLTKRLLLSVIILGTILLFSACSGKSGIVGTWKNSEVTDVIFYEDGEFDGWSEGGIIITSYTIGSDGILKLKSDGGTTERTYKKTDSKEPEYGEYYLKGDTLIIKGTEYKKEK